MEPPETFTRTYSVEDYAFTKGLTVRWVYQLIKEGKLKAQKVAPLGKGNHYWIIYEEVSTGSLRMMKRDG